MITNAYTAIGLFNLEKKGGETGNSEMPIVCDIDI